MRRSFFLLLVACSFAAGTLGQSGSQPPASPPPVKSDPKQASAEPGKLSQQFKESGLNACEAITDMPDIKASDDGYDVKKAAAQKAIDSASQKASNDADQDALKVLKAWLALAIKQYESTARHDMKGFQQAGDAGLYCMAEAKMAFKPQALSEKGRDLAAEKKCLSEYQKIQAAK